MSVKNPRELFVMLLSAARQSNERLANIYQEMNHQTQDPDVKEALESRAWVLEKDISAIDRCFQLIGEQPTQLSGRLQEVLLEDFRKEVSEIQNPVAKAIFVLARASSLAHVQAGAYEVLVEAADVSGHYAVGLLLETCLADKLVFIDRTRRLVRGLIATKAAARAGA
jgi:ferritin-like metal-binding protein YciE